MRHFEEETTVTTVCAAQYKQSVKVFLPAIEKKASEPNFDWTTEGADVMAELYAGAVDTMPLKSEPMEFEVKCVIDAKTNCWRPEDAKAFKANITAATDGMEF